MNCCLRCYGTGLDDDAEKMIDWCANSLCKCHEFEREKLADTELDTL